MQFRQLIVQQVFWKGMYFFSGLVLNILVSRLLRSDGSGWFYYVVNNLSLLLLIIGLSLESGITFYAATNQPSARKMAFLCISWSLAATLLGAAIVYLFSPVHYPEFVSRKEFVPASILYIGGVLLTTYMSGLFYARQDFFLPNLLPILSNFLAILLLMLNKWVPAIGKHFLILYFLCFFLRGLLMTWIYFRTSRSGILFQLPASDEMKLIFKFSLLAFATNLVFFLVYRVDYFFVGKYCNPSDLGNYIQVTKLVQLFVLLPSTMGTVIFPVIARNQHPDIRGQMQQLTAMVFYSFLIVCAGLAIAGNWLFPFVFGDSFSQMYAPFLLLIPGILAISMQALMGSFFAGNNLIPVNLKGAGIALALTITGDILFIPNYGIRAAALVSSIAYTIHFLYLARVFCQKYQASFFRFFSVSKGTGRALRMLWQESIPAKLSRPGAGK
jgi:O-antigen/teichoic acid export membrane protein